jgi:cytochrome c biogenesis protein CcdA
MSSALETRTGSRELLAPIDLDQLLAHDPCEFAKERYYGIARWRSLWTILVFVLGVLIVFMLALAIVFIFDKKWAATVVSGLGGLVTGKAMAFVLDRRKEAKDEEEAAYADVVSKCGGAGFADAVRRRFTLLGIR